MIFDGDRDKLADYIREMADCMGMHDWLLKLADDPPPNLAPDGSGNVTGAFCNVPYGRRYAVIYVNPEWADWEPWELRYIVCHELLHGHLAALEWSFNNVQHVVSTSQFALLNGSFTDAQELTIDAIGNAWAKTLPLPTKGEKGY